MRVKAFVRAGATAIGRVALLGLLSPPVKLALLVLSVVSLALTVVGLGLVLAPLVAMLVRAYADLHRRVARDWSGVEIPRPYRPRPAGAFVGTPSRWLWLVRDPATWRDLLWLLAGAPTGLLLGIVGPVLLAYGLEGLLGIAIIIDAASGWYGYGVTWPIQDALDIISVPPQGALVTAGALYAGPWLLWALAQFDRSLLGPTRGAALAQRVDRLTETRTQVVDAQAAELRRIERDLHDGAQARIVSLGMSLGMAEDLVTRDPAAAQALIAEARQASGLALAELRHLVRGIHPPVLAERGLDGGLRALALTLPVPVAVDVDLDGRPDAPVESAAYFAVAEALTNVVKHAHASAAWVSLTHLGGALYITVGDDGAGGAVLDPPGGGSGLAGVARRLGAFDGSLHVDSPAGGPTVLTMELPCALSSPRTSPSSATG
ncbi:sensor histidine kinase [Dactylosporangium cerinum]|uniref:histidine kinase n=1 Tax=Dactylosporangium cerinum TaxID=1434730 RepID=A0ABV9WNL6_9ACTN